MLALLILFTAIGVAHASDPDPRHQQSFDEKAGTQGVNHVKRFEDSDKFGVESSPYESGELPKDLDVPKEHSDTEELVHGRIHQLLDTVPTEYYDVGAKAKVEGEQVQDKLLDPSGKKPDEDKWMRNKIYDEVPQVGNGGQMQRSWKLWEKQHFLESQLTAYRLAAQYTLMSMVEFAKNTKQTLDDTDAITRAQQEKRMMPLNQATEDIEKMREVDHEEFYRNGAFDKPPVMGGTHSLQGATDEDEEEHHAGHPGHPGATDPAEAGGAHTGHTGDPAHDPDDVPDEDIEKAEDLPAGVAHEAPADPAAHEAAAHDAPAGGAPAHDAAAHEAGGAHEAPAAPAGGAPVHDAAAHEASGAHSAEPAQLASASEAYQNSVGSHRSGENFRAPQPSPDEKKTFRGAM